MPPFGGGDHLKWEVESYLIVEQISFCNNAPFLCNRADSLQISKERIYRVYAMDLYKPDVSNGLIFGV